MVQVQGEGDGGVGGWLGVIRGRLEYDDDIEMRKGFWYLYVRRRRKDQGGNRVLGRFVPPQELCGRIVRSACQWLGTLSNGSLDTFSIKEHERSTRQIELLQCHTTSQYGTSRAVVTGLARVVVACRKTWILCYMLLW